MASACSLKDVHTDVDEPVSNVTSSAYETEEITSSEVTTEEITSVSEEVTAEATTTEVTTQATTEEIPPEPEYAYVNILCAGDNLIHRSIYNQAKRRAGRNGSEGYDFGYVYEQVEKYIESSDLAILNQETIVTDEFEPSDYPRFCTPSDLGRHMQKIGFDIVSLSNNHILDKDEAGVFATLRFWDEIGMPYYGAYKSQEDMDNIRTMTVNGITFAFLGYMEHTNSLELPEGATAKITYLKELELIEEQIKRADEIADVVIVSPHVGIEISNGLKRNQISVIKNMIEWGADIVIGTQAHTVQTMEFVEREDKTKGFVFYCLGNFVSAQSNPKALVGILGNITVSKNLENGEISLSNVKAIPIITQYGYNYSNIHIVPYSVYTDEMLNEHGAKAEGFSRESIENVLSYIPKEYLSVE